MTRYLARNICDQRAAVRQLPLFEELVAGVTMQTTGLARETIVGLYEGEALAQALRDSRNRTLAIYRDVDLERAKLPCIPIVNPPIWELAHIAWFQEYWCLRYDAKIDGPARPSILADGDALFDSRTVPHDSRWKLPYPSAKAIAAYMGDTLDATLAALALAPEDQRYFFRLALLHEDMHGEALLMTLQTMGWPLPAIASEPPKAAARAARDIHFDGGEFMMGASAQEPLFVFDNEKWAHPRKVEPFDIAEAPVTQREFAAFVDDDGYLRYELWSDEGWQWREGLGHEAPMHWRSNAAGWHARRFDRWIPIDAGAPMVHVSLHEAEAFCRWALRRLPTEAEWEFAACNGGKDVRYPWGGEWRPGGCLDLRFSAPSSAVPDPGPSPSGLRQMIGGVWEWTSSPFEGYPGFAPDPYREYSQPWFGSHFVLRGGSFATRGRLVHNRFRNFYLPERTDIFAGFRTCALEAS